MNDEKKTKDFLKKEREILSTRSSSLVTNFFMVIDLFIRLNKWTDNIDDINDNDDDMIADMCVCVWVQLKWMNEWINLSMSTISLSLLVSYLVLLKYSPISLKKLQISFFLFLLEFTRFTWLIWRHNKTLSPIGVWTQTGFCRCFGCKIKKKWNNYLNLKKKNWNRRFSTTVITPTSGFLISPILSLLRWNWKPNIRP